MAYNTIHTEGERTMRNRTKGLIAAIILVALLALGGTASAMALTHNGWGNTGYGAGMMNGQKGYQEQKDQGQQGVMNGQYPRGGMMGGYQQNSGTPVTGVTHMTMQNFMYQYTNIHVQVGTTLTWMNQDNISHSVTFQNGMKDSGLLAPGQSFSYLFNTPGTYQYNCTVHPYMVATVTVVS
jgi:plastocyanin